MSFHGRLERLDNHGIFIDYNCSKVVHLSGDGLVIYAKKAGSGFGYDERYAEWETDFKAFIKKHYPSFDIDAYLAELNRDLTPEEIERYRFKD